MILNRGPVIKENNEDVFFDCSGCSYPIRYYFVILLSKIDVL
nr:hypothetical protein [Latilactobacillus fragifolii]